MIEKCICCGEPISSYPCKFCHANPVPFTCPEWKGGICQITKKSCFKKLDFPNCEVFRNER